MSKSFLEPANDHVLVVDGPREVIIDDIEMPANVRQQDMFYGTVIFVGPKCTETKPEDRVLYGPYAGKTVVFNGNEFRLMREGQIESYVRTTQ